jgi:uncharacterized protein
LPVLSQIFIYPIKSARGIALEQTRVDVTGPARDRRWMLVDSEGGFLSQRRFPAMALLASRFEGENLIVEAPGMPPLRVRLSCGCAETIPVRLFDENLRLPPLDPCYDEWFSTFLGFPCRLVHLPDSIVRPIEPPWNTAPWRTSLADGYPILILGQASLDLLNEKLEEPITIARFRPNLVIAGTAAHEEDCWRRVRIGEVELALVKACARCAIPQVNPETAETGIEPLQTMARYRTGIRNGNRKVFFAQNALVTAPGLLRCGQTIEVLEAAEQQNWT